MKVRNMTFKRALSIKTLIFVFLSLFLLMILIDPVSAVSSDEDRGRKEFWINTYGELKESPLSARTQEVFDRVLAASDRRAGIEPKLFLINYEGKPWAQSLADGSIIISKNAIDFCYTNQMPEQGDSRFAFVAGHELAHQFNGDFWPYRFLRTVEGDEDSMRAFQDIKELAKKPEMFIAKEIQADQYGIIYSALAGYGSEEIISNDKNFFIEWAERESPDIRSNKDLEVFSEKRVKAVSMRLKEVSERIVLFQMGVISYHLGRNDDALALFNRFAAYFPGREVYANIGTIYLRMAYEKFLSSRSPESFPFLLSFGIDAGTRAETTDIARGFEEDKYREYKKLIKMAVENLKKAVEYDPFYQEAQNSLGCALILENKYYDAVSIFEEALKTAPNDRKVQNNLSVAYILLGEKVGSSDLISKAKMMLASAKKYDSTAGSNWNSLLYLEGEISSPDENSLFSGQMFQDIIAIAFNSYPELRAGKTVPDQKRLKMLDDFSSATNGTLKVLESHKEKVFLLARGNKIRMVLYKSPAGIKTNVEGGENTKVFISNSDRKGIILSKNRLPYYFEF